MLCRTWWLRTKLWDVIWVWKSTFWSPTWIFFPRQSRRIQWRTRWKISSRHFGYGKAVPKQLDLKYVGRLLLDTEEGSTWRQSPAKVIRVYILEASFCLFHEHVKYCFAQIQPSVSLKFCLIGNFCIHIWIQRKKYCYVYLLKFVGRKKMLHFVV